MNVFDLDAALVARYQTFAQSFTRIRADDLRKAIDAIYNSDRFWPEPLIGLNPHYQRAGNLARHAADGLVAAALPDVFAPGNPRRPIDLHRHQEQVPAKAAQRRNYIVTTGTGSGRSLCFYNPAIQEDDVLRAVRAVCRSILLAGPADIASEARLGGHAKAAGRQIEDR